MSSVFILLEYPSKLTRGVTLIEIVDKIFAIPLLDLSLAVR